MWAGTWGEGIAYFDGASWTVYDSARSDLPHDKVEALTYDALGRLWVGTWGGGVALFDGAEWIVFDTLNSGLPSNNIRKFLNDSATGKMWICTEGGLASYRYLDSISSAPGVFMPSSLDLVMEDRIRSPFR